MTFETAVCSPIDDTCSTPVFSRGLCEKHYKRAMRADMLDQYPPNAYLNNPEAYIRWALERDIFLVKEIAIEFGYVLDDVGGTYT